MKKCKKISDYNTDININNNLLKSNFIKNSNEEILSNGNNNLSSDNKTEKLDKDGYNNTLLSQIENEDYKNV